MSKEAWKSKLRDILDAAQRSETSHERLLAELREIYERVGASAFLKEFLPLMVYPMSIWEVSQYVNILLLFLAKFTILAAPDQLPNEEDEDDENVDKNGALFLTRLLDFLLKIIVSTNKSVRLRCCQFLEYLLLECARQEKSGCLNEKYWQSLIDVLATRCKDKIGRIRFAAVNAISKLQQPTEANCPAIVAIQFLMAHDPVAVVRRQCVHVITATKHTMKCVVARSRDADSKTREQVYTEVADRKLFNYLRIGQRLELIEQGLRKEKVSDVRQACDRMINAWLAAVDNDIFVLLKRLDVVTKPDISAMVLDVIFYDMSLDNLVIMFEKLTQKWEKSDWLTPENVFCLRQLLQYVTIDTTDTKKKRYEASVVEEWVDKLLPSLFEFCEFIESYSKEASQDVDLFDELNLLCHNFIVEQLLEIVSLMDKSDLAGQNRLYKMIDTMIPIVSFGDSRCPLVQLLVRIRLRMDKNIQRTVEWMADIISDLMAVPGANLELTQASMVDDTIVERFPGNVVVGEVDDNETGSKLYRSLSILSEVLKLYGGKTLATTLRAMCESLVIPGIKNTDPSIRNIAFRCLGLCCIVELDMATQYVGIFLEILRIDLTVVRKTAIEILVDLMVIHRLELAKAPLPDFNRSTGAGEMANPRNAGDTIVLELYKILNSEEEELYDLVKDGITKLRRYVPALFPKDLTVDDGLE